MAVNFYKTNVKFYSMQTSAIDNLIETQYESGKRAYRLRNTTLKHSHSLSFILKDRADEQSFWQWYENNLYCRANTFYLTNIISGQGTKEYRMTAEPQIQDSQYPKECVLKIEEE